MFLKHLFWRLVNWNALIDVPDGSPEFGQLGRPIIPMTTSFHWRKSHSVGDARVDYVPLEPWQRTKTTAQRKKMTMCKVRHTCEPFHYSSPRHRPSVGIKDSLDGLVLHRYPDRNRGLP